MFTGKYTKQTAENGVSWLVSLVMPKLEIGDYLFY